MPITRTFRDLTREELADIESITALARLDPSGGIAWTELLLSPRVLIVAEAGTGKTFECKEQQNSLWNQGQAAFFMELATLAQDGLDACLSTAEQAQLARWKGSDTEIATFFLDSLDELQLTGAKVEAALRRLDHGIGDRFGRAQIVTTARPIPLDRDLFQRLLPLPTAGPRAASFVDIAMGRHLDRPQQGSQSPPPPWRYVTLSPLNSAQIRAMAADQRIDDVDILLAAIRRQNAEDFVRRPLDLIEICVDWRDSRRLRTHREQVHYNIEVKLQPRAGRQERTQLSPDRAMDGATRLAFAAILTRRLSIRYNAEADRAGPANSALNPGAVLTDWRPDERQSLLERGLFGFASYGRVRFHHRSVIEFLAARQLELLLARGMPIRRIERLLFTDTPNGQAVVKPSMRPAAAWLAATQPKIFREVCRREPELLLNQADPRSLTPSQRAEALRAYVERYRSGGWRGVRIPLPELNRFADVDLAGDVTRLWYEGIENPEIRELLLRLIGAGPMPSCADIAFVVAQDPRVEFRERLDAVEALVALSDNRLGELVRSMRTTPDEWPAALVRRAFADLFPRWIRPEHAGAILAGLPSSGSGSDVLTWGLPRVIADAALTQDELMGLVVGLMEPLKRGLAWATNATRYTAAPKHLVVALAATLQRLLVGDCNPADVIQALALAMVLLPESGTRSEPRHALHQILSVASASVRESMFWELDRLNQEFNPQADAWKRGFGIYLLRVLELDVARDREWITCNVANVDRPVVEREMMLDVLFRLLPSSPDERRRTVVELLPQVGDQPTLKAKLETWLVPPSPDPESERVQTEIAKHQEEAERSSARREAEWAAFEQQLRADPLTAFGPEQVESTVWNLFQVIRSSKGGEPAPGWGRAFLEEHFGQDIADRMRNALTVAWRGTVPTLHHERVPADRGISRWDWEIGLAGVAAEAEDPGWARKLSAGEAELATRYASIAINGFPAWLESLAAAHPNAVESVLGSALTSMLEEPALPQSSTIMLQDIDLAAPRVADLVLPRLRCWIEANAVRIRTQDDADAAAQRLLRAIGVLLKHDSALAPNWIRHLAVASRPAANNPELARIWLGLLMRFDPAAGVAALEQELAEITPTVDGPAVGWFATLFSYRDTGLTVDLRQPEFTPELLLRLTRLAYRHVHPSDDRLRDGVFSSDTRDNAEHARSNLLSALLACSGDGAWNAQLALADDPLLAHMRDRVLFLAKEREAEEIDTGVDTEQLVVDVLRYGEAAPRTRDEMFALLEDRLADIEDGLLEQTSQREGWATFRKERLMRRALAGQLLELAKQFYTVGQEIVTADEKEIDILLRSTASDQCAIIELKIGENHSGPVLRDAIADQLVEKYLAAETCGAGCLLVTVADPSKYWEHPETGARLDAAGLETMLQTHANRIMVDRGGALRLFAKVLDLRPRLG